MLRPLRNNLYVIPMEDRSKIGSIIVPDSAKQRVDQGIVKYRGPLTTGEVRRGDHVFFSGYDGSQIVTEDDGLLYVIEEEFIVAVNADDKKAIVYSEAQVRQMITLAMNKTDNAVTNGHTHECEALEYYIESLQGILDSQIFTELSF